MKKKYNKKLSSVEIEEGTVEGCAHSSPFFPCESNNFKGNYVKNYKIKRIIYGYHKKKD